MPLLEIDRRKNIPQNAISSKQEINPFSYPPVGGFEDVLLRSITYKDNEEEVSSMNTIPTDLPDAIKHIREEIRNRSPTRK